jgi:hypothetical protein
MISINTFIKKNIWFLFLLLIFLINPYGKGILVSYILIYYLVSKKEYLKNNVDKNAVWLLIFSVTYSLFYSFNPMGGIQYILIYATSPFVFYMSGKYFYTHYLSEEVYYFLLLFISIGFSVIPIVSIINHIINDGFIGPRNVSLIWNDEVRGATGLASYLTMNIALLGTLFVQKTTKFESKIKLISSLVFIISLLCILRLQSRTQLFISLVMVLLSVFYLIFNQSLKRNIILVFTIIIVVVIIFQSHLLDIVFLLDFQNRFQDTNDLITAGSRMGYWIGGFENIIAHPFGWNSYQGTGGHNLWIDVARMGGIFSFIPFCLFTISSFALVIQIIKISKNHFFNVTILVYFLGLMIVFFAEPIIDGMYQLFIIYCFFIGILSGFVKRWHLELLRSRYKFKNKNLRTDKTLFPYP